MKQRQRVPAGKNQQLIYRPAPGKSLGAIAGKRAEQAGVTLANLYALRNVQKAKALAPLADLLQKAPHANQSSAQIAKIDQQISDLLSGVRYARPANNNVTINIDDILFVAPYDHAEGDPHPAVWPIPDDVTFADTYTGTLQINQATDYDYDGVFNTVVGVGVDLAPSQDGLLELRPQLWTDSTWTAYPSGLDCYVEAGATLTLLEAGSGNPVGPQPQPSFKLFAASNGSGELSQTITGDQMSITAEVIAHVPYQAWVHVYVTGNQSGVYLFGSSAASGWVQAKLWMMLARLHVG